MSNHYSKKRVLVIALCLGLLVLAMGAMSSAASPAPVDISGTVDVASTQSGSLRYTGNPAPAGYSNAYMKGVPEITCMPETTPVNFAGTLDVAAMNKGDVAFIGLLDKGLMASGDKGYQSGAYLYLLKLNDTTLRIGPTDGNQGGGGEIIQTYFQIPIPADMTLDVDFTIDGTVDPTTCGGAASDAGCISVTAEGQTRIDSYGFVKKLFNTPPLYAHDEFSLGAYPGWDDFDHSNVVYDLEVNGCEATPPAVEITSPDTLICNDTATLNVDFSNVPNLYGYEFKINYNSGIANATGSFVTTWFNGSFSAPGWGAQCSGGTCKFASSLQNPATPVSGGGTVASVVFDSVAAGTFDATIYDVVLSDIDGFPIAAEVSSAPVTFNACGKADISGKINLQGRVTPMNAGWIKLVDTGGIFPPIDTTFDANGNYSVTDIPVMPGGSSYKIQATHYLYLGKEKTHLLMPGNNLANQNTTLLGGDANNSGLISPFDEGVDIGDIGCIGDLFGSSGSGACGSNPGNATDINNDNKTNIQDLTIAAGNYMKDPFQQPW